jgi:ribosomal protein S27AE
MTAFSNGSSTSQALKSCPRCLLIAHSDAFQCQKCGHEFQTSLAVSISPHLTLSENQLNRTHMFSLPIGVPKPSTEAAYAAANQQAKQQFAALARQTARRRRRRTRAYVKFALLTLVLAALWWLAAAIR